MRVTHAVADQTTTRDLNAEIRAMAAAFEARNYPPRWTAIDLRDVPAWPGCYALLIDGQVAYVGQTGNLRVRLSVHGWKRCIKGLRTKWGTLRRCKVKFRPLVDDVDRLDLEAKLIRRLRPQFNIRGLSPKVAA